MIRSIKRKTSKLSAFRWEGDNIYDADNFLAGTGVIKVIGDTMYMKYCFANLELRIGDVAFFENGILKRAPKELLEAEFEVN